jgi:hypothetical protein
VEWLTPPEILAPLGDFDLDPCVPEYGMPWKTASFSYNKLADGLSCPFIRRVWLNPPFGAEAKLWIEKLAKHGNGIALLPARTETKMFFDWVWNKASSILFLESRPHFHVAADTWFQRKGAEPLFVPAGGKAPFNSGAPICLIGYGPYNDAMLANSGLGRWVKL